MNAALKQFMSLAHSNGEPGRLSPTMTTIINARFISHAPPLELEIKFRDTHAMKASGLNTGKRQVLSLFQIASHFEDFFPPGGIRKPALAFRQMPFARLMGHPGKLKAVLASAKTKDCATGQSPAKRPARNTPKEENGLNFPVRHLFE